ncbi:MAG: NAD-dependent epimerase/dehydratase family protein [Actinomycetota bacterium]
MKVAVTGGSGVVGSAVVGHLLAAGHEVWALARSVEASEKLDDLGAHVVHGDVLGTDAVGRLVKGSQRVFHIAGVNEMCSRDPARMWRINVEASLLVLDAAESAGVERLIHTSSAVTIGEPHGTVGAEDSPHRGHFLSEYERSKTVAERLLFNRSEGTEVVAVNPSSVQGPGRSTGTGAIFLAAARGRIPFLVDTTISLVDIDDCARGHLLAAEKGVAGERYILSGDTLTVRQAEREIRLLLGRRGSPWFLNPTVVRAAAPIADGATRIMGRPSLLCSESARVMVNGHRYDGTKATRDLGLDYTPAADTIARTLDWFRAEGLLSLR